MQVILEKLAGKLLSPDKVHEQINQIIRRILASNRDKRGWTATIGQITVDKSNIPYKYRAAIEINNNSNRDTAAISTEYNNIISIIKTAGVVPKWIIVSYQDIGGTTKAPPQYTSNDLQIGYASIDIPPNWQSFYSHIYGLEAHIEIVISAILAAQESNWRNRFHVLLHGSPACGKTEVAHTTKMMLGEHSVLEFDATNTTQAGAIKELNERDELPRILVAEELEKADDNSMRWLLGVLDYRGEIRKITARSQIQRSTKMLCIATVNDKVVFDKLMSGALASRFAHQLYFPRPSDEVLRRILRREIELVNGKMTWIEPTLKYAKLNDITDPRQLLAICLSGKDALLSGEYQKKLDKVTKRNGS